MDAHLVKPRFREEQRAATREALPALMALPLRSHADALLPLHQTGGMTGTIIESLARIPVFLALRARLLELEPDYSGDATIRSAFRDPVGRALFRKQMRTVEIGEGSSAAEIAMNFA